ncbi:hypothetical protein [Flavobacterium sp.]|uniref:hypothetical protein n=1 Tax=Flavobacterium sp. TaxID=239 RepID=UPI00352863F1
MKNPYGATILDGLKNGVEKDKISVPILEAKDGYYKEFHDKIVVIPQGFDFKNVKVGEYKKNDIPTFAYAGNLIKNGRDITNFLEYLESQNLISKFIVYTKSFSFFEKFIQPLKGNRSIDLYQEIN